MESKIIDKKLKHRKIKDVISNSFTGLSSFISAFVLFAIIIFVAIRGITNFDFKMVVSDYYETPYFAQVYEVEDYNLDKEDGGGIYYSKHYGIGLKDDKDFEGNHCITIRYIDENSPLNSATYLSDGGLARFSIGQIVKRIQVSDGVNYKLLTVKMGAEAMAHELDNWKSISELYYSTMGGGIRGSLLTTLILIVATLLLSMPLGILAAIYLSVYSKNNKIIVVIRSLIDMLSGVPSIIYGLIGVIVFIPFVSSMTRSSGGSIMSGALTMSIMLLPTIIKTVEESINTIPQGYKLSSLALGASETQTTLKVILPNALPGILTSSLLSIGRIIGESAALIFAIGTAIQDRVSLFDSSTTLAVHIWSVASGQNPNYGMASAISLIILAIVLLLNVAVKLICKKLNKFEVK